MIISLFYIVLFCYSFLSADIKRTLALSKQNELYLQINSLIFLIIGIILTTINIKKILMMPRVLMFSGAIFAIYVFTNIFIRIAAGHTYSTTDTFYSIIELMNIVLPITVAYCFILIFFINKKLFSLRTLSLVILTILIMYALAIYASDFIIPTIKNLFGLEISIDALARNIDRSIGYRRLYGPLGGPTSLGIILIPISGYFLYLYKKNSRIFYICIILLTSFLVILTASRAAILGQSLLILSYLLMKKRFFIIIPIISLLLMAFIMTIAPILPSKKLNPFKKEYYVDPRRVTTLTTCLKAWLSTPTSFLFGAGYNEITLLTKNWNLAGAGIIKPELIVTTRYGILFRGPHSIFNWALSGIGLIGLALRCSFVYIFIYCLFRKALKTRSKEFLIFPFSIFFSMINLFTDDLHIIYPMLMTCWFIFYIYAYKIINTSTEELSKFQ